MPLRTHYSFLLVRGDYAWIGFGFKGCPQDANYTLPPDFQTDYGKATGRCRETATKGVFERAFSNGTVRLNCRTWTANISAGPAVR